MCRCCQRCLEDFYWNCIEERFCYDESIANYNPDDDELVDKNNIKITSNDNNNVLPIISQPPRNNYTFSGKIHEEDYRREIQTSVPILAPEILAVFTNSQIFNEPKPNLSRVNTTKSLIPTPSVHSNNKKFETDQEKLIFHLEGPSDSDSSDSTVDSKNSKSTLSPAEKNKIKFTISDASPIELVQSPAAPKYPIIEENVIEEEEEEKDMTGSRDEVILRPRLQLPDDPLHLFRKIENKPLRNVQSVPYFTVRPVSSENDIFAISGSYQSISMTPEVPSISYSNLPKNYEDTPTIEKYKETITLQAIQTANLANADRNAIDYSNPKYFRRTALMVQSVENLKSIVAKEEQHARIHHLHHHKAEKSKRLKNFRGSLPPLLIHMPKHKRDESKQLD